MPTGTKDSTALGAYLVKFYGVFMKNLTGLVLAGVLCLTGCGSIDARDATHRLGIVLFIEEVIYSGDSCENAGKVIRVISEVNELLGGSNSFPIADLENRLRVVLIDNGVRSETQEALLALAKSIIDEQIKLSYDETTEFSSNTTLKDFAQTALDVAKRVREGCGH